MNNRIKIRRAELNISQEELAEKSGLCRATIVNIEKGKNIPSGDSMLKIAHALNTQIEEIFFLSDL